MNPFLAQQLASQRGQQLRPQAREPRAQARPRRRRPHAARLGPSRSVRHRAGWTLVAIGLRLAVRA
jgi:hypothetical protein